MNSLTRMIMEKENKYGYEEKEITRFKKKF